VVKARDPETGEPKIPTGEIEVFIRDLEVLGAAEELPLPVFGEQEYPEETRLRYRFLDLRRERLHANMMLRSAVVADLRRRMWGQGFTEFQTPIITASSPEGARDFLVPSRLHPGKFYALPQAPQQFKQLIMVAGFDRYFQIAPCFRDEDPRADRSPTDFYQLDLEMSFVTQEDVFAAIQPVIQGVFEEFGGGRRVDADWPRIPTPMSRSGTGPTSRTCATRSRCRGERAFPRLGLRGLREALEQEGTEVRAIPAKGGGSRAFCDRMNAWAQKEGLPGMGYIFWRDGEQGLEAARAGRQEHRPRADRGDPAQLGLGSGDAAFFLAGKPFGLRGGRGAGAQRDRQGAGADRGGPLRLLLDRRLPDVREGPETGRSTSRTTPSRCRRAGSRRWRAIRSRSRASSTTSPATATS
jgi:aspartyl-tRNA synthetase